MQWTRRKMLMSGAGLLGSALLGLPRARAQTRTSTRLILLMARGGWDPVVALDPKEEGAGVSMPPGTRFRRGALDLYDADATQGAVRRYFERHGDVTAVVRGLTVASVAHDACTRRILTGTPSAAAPDMGAVNAADGGPDRPLPYLVLGAPAYSGPYAAQSGRVGSSNQLVSVLDPAKAFPPPGPPSSPFVPSAAESDAVQAFLQRRGQALAARVGAYGENRRRIDDYLTSVYGGDDLRAYSDVFGDVTTAIDMNQQVDTALDMLEREVVWSVSMDTGVGWDTHTASHADQTANNVVLFDGLGRLLDGLKARPGSRGGRLIDETAVVVFSEMGRTPLLNADGGKDHWQVTSAMVIGSDVPGERAYGQTTETGDPRGVLQAELLDFATGQPQVDGRMLEAAEFVAGVVAWTGGDAARYLPGVTPFMPWVT